MTFKQIGTLAGQVLLKAERTAKRRALRLDGGPTVGEGPVEPPALESPRATAPSDGNELAGETDCRARMNPAQRDGSNPGLTPKGASVSATPPAGRQAVEVVGAVKGKVADAGTPAKFTGCNNVKQGGDATLQSPAIGRSIATAPRRNNGAFPRVPAVVIDLMMERAQRHAALRSLS